MTPHPSGRPQDGSMRVGLDEVAVRLSTADTGGRLLAFDVTMPPGGGPPAMHRHDPVEVYRVLEGELAFYLEDTRTVERAGAVVHIAGGREHTIRNESAVPARAYVTFLEGAERMEEFMRAAARAGTVDEVMAAAREHGIEVTRALPSGG
jgi:mannose-6-phosphate isomerase-like protein (cupin superfamily)